MSYIFLQFVGNQIEWVFLSYSFMVMFNLISTIAMMLLSTVLVSVLPYALFSYYEFI